MQTEMKAALLVSQEASQLSYHPIVVFLPKAGFMLALSS